MDKATAERRLRVTRGQIGRIEKMIADALNHQNSMQPETYEAMVAGYQSQLADLRRDEAEYEVVLA